MKSRNLFLYVLAALLAAISMSARSEDIDLFSGPRGDQALAPNLLLILDNGANFGSDASGTSCIIDGVATALSGKTGGVEQCALYNMVRNMDLSSGAVPVNLGVMVYNGNNVVDFNGNACVGSVAGCLVYPLTPLTATSRPIFLNWVRSWKIAGGGFGYIKGPNSGANGAVMQESWAYLNGRVGLSGRNYSAIAPNTACKNFVVFIGNAFSPSGQAGDSTGDAGPRNALEGRNSNSLMNAIAPVNTELIKLNNSPTPPNTFCGTVNFPGDNNHENSGYYADEWARYMRVNRITTYTVGFHGTGCKAEYAWLLSSMASAGGGTYFPTTNYQQLLEALQTILSEVRSVNSVFAAVSLPVSVNSQGTYLNQVFIGMFRPDTTSLPRWQGNLKQYKMGFLASNNAFSLLDADDKLAISASGSDFIAECARSYWTPGATAEGDGYFTQLTDPNCTGFPASSNSPDGNMVEKGGQGYMVRKMTPANRVVTTCASSVSGCTSLTSFSTGNGALTAAALGIPATSSVTAGTLINWTRGANNHATNPEAASLNGAAITSSNMRPSSHGDVVHSRPAAVNFGTDTNPRVVVFYGGNDGMLRAINGNRTAAINNGTADIAAGDEFWSFVPPEFYTKLLRRYNNSSADRIQATNRKDYAMDGPITAHRRSNGDAWLYVGMRRGGRTLYAFNVNRSTLAVTMKWKIGCLADDNCNAATLGDYTGMGQTWSPPQLFTARGYESGASPLLIVGGGYDATCEDAATFSTASPCGTATKGRGFYVLDADNGQRKRLFGTVRSVVADVTVVPDADGHAMFIYGADLAGNVYRISGPLESGQYQPIGTHPIANWVVTTVASLGCASTLECTAPPNRKFMFAPDVVRDGSAYILLLGSGDREKPTELGNTTSNYFFMIKDRPDLGNSYLADAACGSTYSGQGLCLNALLGITPGTTPSSADLTAKKGWYLRLAANEQVVTGAIAVFGTVYFTTHEPKAAASNACVPNLGTSRAYAVKYTDAAPGRTSGDLFLAREDAGLAPDLVVGKVTLDNDSTVPFCIGCDGPIKPSQPVAPGLVNNPAKIRSYWYIQK